MLMQCAGITHVGRVRTNNEDNLLIDNIYKENISDNYFSTGKMEVNNCICAVCDGVGGESLGEVASLEAIKVFANSNVKEFDFEEKIKEANSIICEERKRYNHVRIGSTIAALVVLDGTASLCNVGDSRIYRYRNSSIEQLTKDHTRAQQLVDAGLIDEETARSHKLSHVLTQHLGVLDEEFILSPYTCEDIDIKQSDVFLLCSDGITDMLDDCEITELIKKSVEKNEDADMTARSLLIQALENGGKDNATVIVIKILHV